VKILEEAIQILSEDTFIHGEDEEATTSRGDDGGAN
jgi:hypothetical protein